MKNELKEVKYSLTKKLSIGLFSIWLIAGLALSFVSYFYNKNYIQEVFSRITNSCASDVANMMSDDPFDKFLNGEEKDLYNAHLKSLRNIANTFGLKYLYVYVPDTKNNRLISIMGVEGETGKIIKDFNLGESPKHIKLNKQVMDMYYKGGNNLNIQINNEYGAVLSGYSTVLDKNSKPVAIVGADIAFGTIHQNLAKDITKIFLAILISLIIIHYLVMQYIKKTFIKPILQLSTEMESATNNSDMEYKPITLNTNDEFNTIAGLYNSISLKNKQMGSELLIARTIQLSSLPSEFPPYPDRKEFDIYANMVPAKEVGGDFYDFFFINPDKFMFLIADVSGKGVPAALFMMTSKTLIKSISEENCSPKEIINKINRQICENNKQGFFITMFAAIIDVKTGDVTYMNCGHNPPLIKRLDGKYEYLPLESNLVLGALFDFDYNIQEAKLNKGDVLFLYTDGVTEALNEENELYGENRLLNVMNSQNNINETEQKQLIENISFDIKEFAQNAEQSDDITMLVFKFNGQNNCFEEKIKIPAQIKNYSELYNRLEKFCKKANIDNKILTKIQLISEELFVNIANYAYSDENETAQVSIKKTDSEITIQFIDNGKPYNPLEKEDPDITENIEERPIGGLGIYMVKQTADSIDYQYKDNMNILTVKINI